MKVLLRSRTDRSGLIAAPLGLADLAIALVYMIGLPRELGVSHQVLLLDRLS
ncbi:MAG: hypothetical protein ACT4QB_10650 [Gammaproteobacteria bacterium]